MFSRKPTALLSFSVLSLTTGPVNSMPIFSSTTSTAVPPNMVKRPFTRNKTNTDIISTFSQPWITWRIENAKSALPLGPAYKVRQKVGPRKETDILSKQLLFYLRHATRHLVRQPNITACSANPPPAYTSSRHPLCPIRRMQTQIEIRATPETRLVKEIKGAKQMALQLTTLTVIPGTLVLSWLPISNQCLVINKFDTHVCKKMLL